MVGFNSYMQGVDLTSLREYCMGHGRLTRYARGDYFVKAGETSRYVGYVGRGCFKYVVHNEAEQKAFVSGFAFANEFVGDYPRCLVHGQSDVTIIAMAASEVLAIDGEELRHLFQTDATFKDMASAISEHLFLQVYSQYLDFYRASTRERYASLLRRCPQIVQHISLKDIASYLHVTPTTISTIRREMTFGV